MQAIEAQAAQAVLPPSLFSADGMVGLIFLLTLFIVVSGALIAVCSRRLVRSVAGLAVCFTGLAGIYYFLFSPFLAMMQMLIYVGAVAVLIAFAVMMASPEEQDKSKPRPFLAGAAAFSVAALMFAGLTVLGLYTQWPASGQRGEGNIREMGTALLTTHSMVFELISIVLLLAIIGALVLARKGRSNEV